MLGYLESATFCAGRTIELRRLVDSLTVGPSRGVSAAAQIPGFSARIRALAHIAAQRMDAMIPDSDGHGAGSSAGGAAEMASLYEVVGRGDASSGRTGVVAGRCWQDVTSPVHGRIVDHELVRVWLVCILLGGDVIFFRSVVGMGMHVPYFIHLRPVLETILFYFFISLLLLSSYCTIHICHTILPDAFHFISYILSYA